jgi:Flp pilus assembly pilin Flp
MRILAGFLKQLWDDENRIPSVEYAMLLAFVAGSIIVAAN